MKAIFNVLLIAIGMLFGTTGERHVEETYSFGNKEIVELDFRFADEIRVNTWNKNEVQVKVRVNINENEDNDAFILKTEETGNTLKIISKIENMNELAKRNYIVIEDEDGDTTIKGCSVEMDLFFEVMIPASAELKIETISGDIYVDDHRRKSKIESISGKVDYSMKSTADADFKLKTISGDIFTDMDLEIDHDPEEGYHHLVGGNVEARLNDGGELIKLETISGNIYLREKK